MGFKVAVIRMFAAPHAYFQVQGAVVRGQRRERERKRRREGEGGEAAARLLTFLRCRTLDLSGKRDWIYGRVFLLPS